MPLVDLVHPREDPVERHAVSRRPADTAVLELLLSTWCWTVLAMVTLTQYGKGRLLERWRGPAVWGPTLRAWGSALIGLGGCRLRVEGSLEVEGPAVLVANHQSAFDIPLLASLVAPPVVFVAREDLFALPIVGAVLRRGGHVAVDREGSVDRQRVVERSLEQLRSGGKVIFFAEGTRSESGAVRPLRAGAFRAAREAGCPLVPVAIAGTRHVVAKGGRLLRPGRLAVSFLPAVSVDREVARAAGRRRLRHRLAAEVRRLEAAAGPRPWRS